MRKKLRRILDQRFQEEMQRQMPEFVLRTDIPVPRGDKVFSSSPAQSLTLFVILEIKEDRDAFNIALAWNAAGEDFVRFAGMSPRDAPVHGKLRFPLYLLWEDRRTKSPWYWQVTDPPSLNDPGTWVGRAEPEAELVTKLEQLVVESVGLVASFGRPYFAKIFKEFQEGRR